MEIYFKVTVMGRMMSNTQAPHCHLLHVFSKKITCRNF